MCLSDLQVVGSPFRRIRGVIPHFLNVIPHVLNVIPHVLNVIPHFLNVIPHFLNVIPHLMRDPAPFSDAVQMAGCRISPRSSGRTSWVSTGNEPVQASILDHPRLHGA